MYQLAPNIELLFTEAGDYHDRVRAAAASGFTAVEMWGPTGADAPATPKDLPALKAALEETGTQLTAQLAEPRTQFMIPPWDHSEFFRKLDEGVEIAHFLGTPRMVVGSGTGFGGWKRQVQLDKLIEIYQKAIAQIEGSGITLVLEPVNVRVDHPGSLLDRTSEGVYVARGVDSPFFGVLYDIYHSAVEGEDIEAELTNAGRSSNTSNWRTHPAAASPEPATSTGRPRWRCSVAPVTTVRSAWSTTRRPRPKSRSATSATWRRGHDGPAIRRRWMSRSSAAARPAPPTHAY